MLLVRIFLSRISVMLTCITMIPILAAAGPPQKSTNVVKQPGDYASPTGKYKATLTVSDMGGGLTLVIENKSSNKQSEAVKDVTGLAWLKDNRLVYSVSPIYGKPGLFLVNCETNRTRRILGPKTINKGYPEGADYFELVSITGVLPGKILFYYAADVDAADFNKFRVKNNLYQININGSQFKKVQ